MCIYVHVTIFKVNLMKTILVKNQRIKIKKNILTREKKRNIYIYIYIYIYITIYMTISIGPL